VENLMPVDLSIPEILADKHGIAENASKKQQNSNILQCFISSQNCLNFTSMVGAGNGYEEPYKFFLQNARNSFAYFLKFCTLTHNI